MNSEAEPHLHRNRQERIVKAVMNHNSLRHIVSAWLTIVTLIAAPAISSGRLVCLKGMPQAGAASCPRCHGHAVPDNSCCKWIEPGATTAVHVAGPTLSPPTALGLIAAATPAVQLASLASPVQLTAGPPGSSPPQTTILRL